MPKSLLALSVALAFGVLICASPHAAQAGAPSSDQGIPAPKDPGMYVLNLSNGGVINVGPLSEFGSPVETAWSPDAKKIAVAAAADVQGGHDGLQVVDLTTGAVTSIAASNQGRARQLRWSPDGTQLAFIFEPQLGSVGTRNSTLQVWRASDKTVFNLVPSGAMLAAWTPDGTGITVAVVPLSRDLSDAGGRIVTLNPRTGDVMATILTGRSVQCQLGLAWSPDGRYVAYGGHGFHEGCLDGVDLGLWSWEASTGTTRHLFSGTSSPPLWMTDGTALAQVAPVGGPTGLGDISLSSFQPDGSGQRTLAGQIPNMFPPPDPAFQTANGEVMYAIQQCQGASSWVIDPGTSQTRNITSPTMYALGPHLSPDGRTVVFSGVGSKGAYLALAQVDGNRTTTPIVGASGMSAGDFSPDGSSIAFAVIPEQPSLCLGP